MTMQLPLGARALLYGAYNMVRSPFASDAIMLWPPVDTQERLDDFTARVRFHFPKGFRIIIPHTKGLHVPTCVPPYLADFSAACTSEIQFVEANSEVGSLLRRAFTNRGLILTQPSASLRTGGTLKYFPNVAPLDPAEVEMETFWLAKFHEAGRAAAAEQSRKVIRQRCESLPAKDKVYLLCTGPSLSRFAEFDFSDGHVIGCNTVVSNIALMRHATPAFIVASDPIFHFGPGIYSEKFRQDLATAARKFDFQFLTLATYHHLMPHLSLPKERVAFAALRLDTRALPLADVWSVPQTANILTMFMLPLARSLAKNVFIIGADGREPGENYFWKHDPASQLTDKMQAIKAAHPAFFENRNYEDYYERHCEILAQQIDEIESTGGRVNSLTPSHIPALAKRVAQ